MVVAVERPRAHPERTGRATAVLERRRRLSESVLWTQQRAYFEREGPRAWSGGTVPHQITSSPRLAAAYADVVMAFLGDCVDRLDVRSPLHVVELGAGCGRLAFHLSRRLERRRDCSPVPLPPLRYVLTDVAESTIAAWRSQPKLAARAAAGALDFAHFDALADDRLTLLESGATLGPGSVANPLVVVANYVFDGLPQDSFLLTSGCPSERVVTLSSPRIGLEAGDPAHLAELEASWEDAPVARDRFEDPDDAALLEEYRAEGLEATIPFPTGALRCLRTLERLAGGPVLLLVADKGPVSTDDFPRGRDLGIARHGSVSLPVNFDALARVVRRRGGLALLPSRRPARLAIGAYVLGARPERLRGTSEAYAAAIDEGGPEDVDIVRRALVRHAGSATLEELLALVRLSRWDPKLFLDLLPQLERAAAEAPAAARAEVVAATERVRDAYLPIGEATDLASALAPLLAGLDEHASAVDLRPALEGRR